jgi:hypothetical protein
MSSHEPGTTPRFIKAMVEIQGSRSAEVGGHLWQRHLNRHGPTPYMWELVGITGRIEHLLVHRDPAKPFPVEKLKDLLVDLGNYSGFLYEWLEHQEDLGKHLNLQKLGTPAPINISHE